jgi:NADPH2:quinone reductase
MTVLIKDTNKESDSPQVLGHRVVVEEFAENPVEGVENNVQIIEQPLPDTSKLANEDVIVHVKSASLGWVDLLMTSGQYQHMPPLPYSPGLEYSGEVIWTGSSVTKHKIGDRVLVDGFQAGPRSPGNYQQYGGFASYAVAPEEALLAMPEGFSFDQACNLLGSYETAYYCLLTCGQLLAGETVLIHGASGATGLAAVHIAKMMGATVIATGRNDEKLALVKEQGADHVINCKDEPKFRQQVKDLTAGKGVDVVYDAVGGAISLESLRCVKFGARFLIVGWASTPFVAKGKGQREAPNANMLPTNLIMMKGLRVMGCPTVISSQQDPTLRPARIKQLMEWVAEGKIQPYVSHAFPLIDVKKALLAKWNGEILGGCVLRP